MRATSLALILTVSTLAFAPIAQAHDGDDGPREGDIEKTHALLDFDSIDVRGVYRLSVTVGEDYSVFTAGSAKEVEHMKVYVEDGVLVLDQHQHKTKKARNRKGIWAEITLPSLLALNVKGVGTGDIEGVDSEAFAVDVSGVGELTIEGSCGQLDMSLRGVGEINAKGLECADADVNLKGVGAVSMFASKSVDVKAKGIGEADVYGSPEFVKKSKGFLSGVTVH